MQQGCLLSFFTDDYFTHTKFLKSDPIWTLWGYVTQVASKNCRLTESLSPGFSTVEPRYNDSRYNNIPGITMKILCPGKSYRKMNGTGPGYNDLRYIDNPDITMIIWWTEHKIIPQITILSVHTTKKMQNYSIEVIE